MASTPRADVTSRTRGEDTFEAGVHADAEVGAIDVGLAVQKDAIGIVIDAPVVGQLKVALEVAPDGTTRLASMQRRLIDGTEAKVPPLVVIDETRIVQLEGQLEQQKQELCEDRLCK